MGLFDKLKGIVQGTQDAASQQQQAQPQPQQSQPEEPAGDEPCTLARYAEIGGAQSAWEQQGRDVNTMLQQQFGVNAIEWSNLRQYWSAKIAGDYRIGLQCTEMQTKYEEQYLNA